MQPVYLANYTLSTCLGQGKAANWQAVTQSRSGLAPCAFETVLLPTFVGEVQGIAQQALPERLSAYLCRNNQLALLTLLCDDFAAAVQAAKQTYGAARIGVFLGTSTSGILSTELAYRERDATTGALPADFHYAQTHNAYSVAGFVRDYFELAGPAIVVSSACSSSAKVFGNAARMMDCGLIDAAIVGGVDSLCLTTLYGFNSLELLSPQPCSPFDQNRSGISIGEAAGFALLTKKKTSSSNVVVLGIGESSDAHHMSTPHPEGAGALAAMQQALNVAKLNATDIDYINLHGTATRSNDASEGLAVATLFGNTTPCSSTKGHHGHALGAAGIIEAILCALALEEQLLPGGVNTKTIDAALAVNYLLSNQAKAARYMLSNSFGFGGSNSSLVLGRL